MIKIHDLRQRVTLMKRKVVETEDGSFQEMWVKGDEVWAQVLPIMGREELGEGWNGTQAIQGKYKVTIRFRKNRFDRIHWEARVLGLLSPPYSDQQRQWLVCLMYEVGENNG